MYHLKSTLGNLLLLHGRSVELHLTTVPLATCPAKRRSHSASNLQKLGLERFVFVFYTVVRMNKEAITLHSSQELSLPSSLINCGKRQSCARKPFTGALAFSRLNQRQGKSRGLSSCMSDTKSCAGAHAYRWETLSRHLPSKWELTGHTSKISLPVYRKAGGLILEFSFTVKFPRFNILLRTNSILDYNLSFKV